MVDLNRQVEGKYNTKKEDRTFWTVKMESCQYSQYLKYRLATSQHILRKLSNLTNFFIIGRWIKHNKNKQKDLWIHSKIQTRHLYVRFKSKIENITFRIYLTLKLFTEGNIHWIILFKCRYLQKHHYWFKLICNYFLLSDLKVPK